MLKFHDVEQNTDEWLSLRVGKITGSDMGKIMANYGKAFGDPAKRLAISTARELVTGRASAMASFSNEHTERGHTQEPIARKLYEDTYFVDVTNGGFFENGPLGCSPDGLVLSDGLVEIKSVMDHVHYANIKRGGVDPAYRWQVYFNLMLTEREWIDFISYCADFPEQTQLYTHRVYRKDCSIEFTQITARLHAFISEVEKAKDLIRGGNEQTESHRNPNDL